MSIHVVCPNGHALNVKESLAGKTGLCPKCKARVQVPELRRDELSEDSIMSILGPHVSKAVQPSPVEASPVEVSPVEVSPVEVSPETVEAPQAVPVDSNSPPKKSCHRCNRVISSELHICPFCHTFIAKLRDF